MSAPQSILPHKSQTSFSSLPTDVFYPLALNLDEHSLTALSHTSKTLHTINKDLLSHSGVIFSHWKRRDVHEHLLKGVDTIKLSPASKTETTQHVLRVPTIAPDGTWQYTTSSRCRDFVIGYIDKLQVEERYALKLSKEITAITSTNDIKHQIWQRRHLHPLPANTVLKTWILADAIARRVPEYPDEEMDPAVGEEWREDYGVMRDVAYGCQRVLQKGTVKGWDGRVVRVAKRIGEHRSWCGTHRRVGLCVDYLRE
ncbi:hypothetical protein HDV00_008077 [Rhizophlyctis rosea]|nr:hypothetical protein HDV00_008077 [Rhizophlyctis rosea]